MQRQFIRWAVAGAVCALWSVSAYAQTVVSADTYVQSGTAAGTNLRLPVPLLARSAAARYLSGIRAVMRSCRR